MAQKKEESKQSETAKPAIVRTRRTLDERLDAACVTLKGLCGDLYTEDGPGPDTEVAQRAYRMFADAVGARKNRKVG